ncbi:unnamed protein product [Oppiella nova]|uniref:Uncharacterized protein n=1 Tax=Oppiella nova TaxID=334625 RepID=A0A7R9MI24_9ACAR|nr:unnamed protein product [Oppiella nova]CAG2176601.1 unnamed protein product [Oppiella nova]
MGVCGQLRLVHLWRFLLTCVYEFGTNLLGLRGRVKSDKKLNGQVVVVTGANTGIGKETAYQMTLREAKVYIGCRDVVKGETAVKDIVALNPKADIKLLKLDLSSLQSVRHFAKDLSQLESKVDILINNAGVMACPEWQTEDGFEMQFGTNHLGHFLLTLHLVPLLRKSSAARVITVASSGHGLGNIHLNNINLRNGDYHPWFAYGQSKLANVLFSRELAKRLRHTNINTYSLNPGAIDTDLQRHVEKSDDKPKGKGFMRRNLLMTPFMGSQTTLYCALEEDLDDETGYYYDNCRRIDYMIPEANDDKTAKALWILSEDFVKLEDHLRI